MKPADHSAALALVVVTYSPGTTLDALLDSLPAATSAAPEVVLADNGSTDGSPQRAAGRPWVRLIETGANLGFGQAANVGARATATEWVLICNADIVFAPGSIDALMAATERWPRGASFGPLIRTKEGEIYPSARALPSLGRGVGHALLGWIWPTNPWTAAYRAERTAPAEGPAGWLSGSCLLVRREAFDTVHGFDPAYFMYFEDVELGYQLHSRGWLNVYVPSAEISHLGGHATSRVKPAMAKAHHDSAYRYLSRRYDRRRQAPIRAVLWLGLRARLFAARLIPRRSEGARPARPAGQLPPASEPAAPTRPGSSAHP